MKDIATKSTTNYILEKYDLYPKKKYGQNFLIDPHIVEKIVCSSSVDKECAVIEVGPGIGALTQVLARYAGYVRSYEIDTRFKGVYEEFLNEDHIDVVFDDFLKIDLTTLESLKEKYKEYLNILKQNSYRLLRLVNNVMDITKVNSDSDKLNLVNCNIVSVLEEIVMSTVLYASEKKRNIIFDTDSEEIILACDEDKIERIMLNLISNAIKFSQLHTDIEIKIKRNVDLNRVYISVKNYGSNIEFNDREKIFERFHRVDNSLNRKNEGCGIGLFLCRKFIEMHGGEIFLDNIDNGTQFSFYLPINITSEKIYNPLMQKDSLIEKCNIEFSDIYT